MRGDKMSCVYYRSISCGAWLYPVLVVCVSVYVLVLTQEAAAVPNICFNCTHLREGEDCKTFNPCSAGQECFHEVSETDSGEASLSWGCASTQLCRLEQGLTERKKRLNIQRCFECCTDNFCNFGPCKKDYCAKVTCENNASCRNTPVGHVCDCLAGYTGELCDIDINECAGGPCQNGATCSDLIAKYTCTCLPGYTGTNCETEIDECASSPCQNGATCVDEVARYTCSCLPGFTGQRCEIDIDECASAPCQYNGTCQDLIDDYSCDCIPGITGTNCEIDINECANVTCQHGGVCRDKLDDFQCSCPYGFDGTYCENSLGRVCYSCDSVTDLPSCGKQVICAKDEECYVEHELAGPGSFLYSAGCVPTSMCAYLTNNGTARRATHAIQLCYQCCDNNGCNDQACADFTG